MSLIKEKKKEMKIGFVKDKKGKHTQVTLLHDALAAFEHPFLCVESAYFPRTNIFHV